MVYGLSDRQLQPGLEVLDGIGCNHWSDESVPQIGWYSGRNSIGGVWVWNVVLGIAGYGLWLLLWVVRTSGDVMVSGKGCKQSDTSSQPWHYGGVAEGCPTEDSGALMLHLLFFCGLLSHILLPFFVLVPTCRCCFEWGDPRQWDNYKCFDVGSLGCCLLFMPPPFEEWWRGIKCYPCPCVRASVRASVRPSVRYQNLVSAQ